MLNKKAISVLLTAMIFFSSLGNASPAYANNINPPMPPSPSVVTNGQTESKMPDPNFMDKVVGASQVAGSHLPYYGANAVVDTYSVDGMLYLVDASTQDVVTIEPEVMAYSIKAVYTKTQLEDVARNIITQFLGVNALNNLSPSFGKKIGTNFFRWEDATSQLDDGSYPFIQIGLSQNGDFLNLVNTLPFGKQITSLSSLPALKFSAIYANGGAYWSKSGTMKVASGGWYKTHSGCSGTFCSTFYYATTGSCSAGCITGTWKPIANLNTKAAVFIPSTHATVKATYMILTNNNVWNSRVIDQNVWFNAFVNITPTVVIGIRQVQLKNLGTAGKEAAWDELWVYQP